MAVGAAVGIVYQDLSILRNAAKHNVMAFAGENALAHMRDHRLALSQRFQHRICAVGNPAAFHAIALCQPYKRVVAQTVSVVSAVVHCLAEQQIGILLDVSRQIGNYHGYARRTAARTRHRPGFAIVIKNGLSIVALKQHGNAHSRFVARNHTLPANVVIALDRFKRRRRIGRQIVRVLILHSRHRRRFERFFRCGCFRFRRYFCFHRQFARFGRRFSRSALMQVHNDRVAFCRFQLNSSLARFSCVCIYRQGKAVLLIGNREMDPLSICLYRPCNIG